MEKKNYTNGEITVSWEPKKCIHSANCLRFGNNVFDPKRRPWIDLSLSNTEHIIDTVQKCPSGALSFFHNEKKADNPSISPEFIIEILPDGPIICKNSVTINHSDGTKEIRTGVTALCRCGLSENKPFCDGSHKK
jgi:uncharacterized Fe-S cluster protein YjdI